MDQLGPNALGEVLEPGRVADATSACCCLQDPPANPRPARPASSPRPRCCILEAPQPYGSRGLQHRAAHRPPRTRAGRKLAFLADLTGELRAWPHDTWAKVGVDPDQVAQAVIGCWRDGQVTGLQLDDLGFEEGPLAHPAGDDHRPRPAPRP